jgi:ferric iron reductase protein FhuF
VTVLDVGLAPFPAIVARLAVVSEHVGLVVGRPVGVGWVPFPSALEAASRWHEDLTVAEGDRRAAASYLATWIAEVPALTLGVPYLFGASIPVVEAGDLFVRRHADGWFDGLAVDVARASHLATTPGEVARLLHTLTEPLVSSLAATLPVGATAIWGSIADALAGTAVHRAYDLGVDADETWAATMALLDALEEHLDVHLVRPEPLFVRWSGGRRRFQTRGTCCLYHRTCAEPIDGDGSCTTCPLRSPATRTERLVRWLESQAAEVSERSS